MPRRTVVVKAASTLVVMGSEGGESWRESAVSNRERIRALEHEMERTRDALHQIRADVQTTRYLAEKITELARDVRELATRVEAVATHAMRRPSQSGLVVFGQYVGLLVAIIALAVAATR